MKDSALLALSALSGALAAVIVSGAIVSGVWPGGSGSSLVPAPGAPPSGSDGEALPWRSDPDWVDLIGRVAALEDRARLAPVVGQERRVTDGGNADLAELAARIDELETADWGRSIRGFQSLGESGLLGDAEDAAEERSAESIILDPSATDVEKVEAHRGLRREEGAYTDAMVHELLRIAESSPEEETRSSAWTFFDGATVLPEIVPHLMNAARNDPSAAVRTEATETLGNYLDDPSVRALLESIVRDDPAKAVRDRAQRTLQ